ncbi:MAG: hypothetical protein JRI23_16285 [Deltaproteobacteria bacterium]|jgi:hypothetical protein|nr:hypothetical protein [Deltaproteobacteria bacterium]MBW2533330.1 hypothetical protein [Deltaproteobacteria bacterium]
MKQFILWSLGGLTAFGLALFAGCDSSDDGNGTGGSTASGTGGACTCYPCSEYIAECINECPAGDPREVVCDSALPTLISLNQCICDPSGGDCRDVCQATCALSDALVGGGGPGGAGTGGALADDPSACIPCQSEAIATGGPCIAEWDACAASDSCN